MPRYKKVYAREKFLIQYEFVISNIIQEVKFTPIGRDERNEIIYNVRVVHSKGTNEYTMQDGNRPTVTRAKEYLTKALLIYGLNLIFKKS